MSEHVTIARMDILEIPTFSAIVSFYAVFKPFFAIFLEMHIAKYCDTEILTQSLRMRAEISSECIFVVFR